MPERVFLDLLAREAPVRDFEDVVTRAARAGADDSRLAELEAAKRTALQVRATLRSRRRRESELAALFDTAGDLAGLRDLDAVLAAIVRRARALLGTDTAYLSLFDTERGDTYMRVTDGSVSPAFQRVRLPMGAGLGGLVAQRVAPYATASYFTDDRFRHTSEIDSAVVEEGLVAILGVPLVRGPQVIGVLFAADRAERHFGPDEVALLASLAHFAAVGIETARMFEENARAMAEVNAATSLVREHSVALERAVDAHDRLTELVLRGGTVQDVATAVRWILDGEITVLDEDGELLSATGPPVPYDDGLACAAAASRSTGRAVRHGDHWLATVVAGSQHLGSLVLTPAAAVVSDADVRTLERSALVTAVLLMLRRSLAEAEQRVRGELVDDLVSRPHRDPASLVERGRRLGVHVDRPLAVLAARGPAEVRQRLAFAAGVHASSAQGLAGET
ncbi:MAG: GAF domain-containing protein, partial [Actinomycetota bacterium]|nr:GAF domain-containing protein [Actinomycetota bacterium]